MTDPDPNEAYEIIPMPDHPRGPHGWWTVKCNGIEDRHFNSREKAEAYATDPAVRAKVRAGEWKYHDR